METFSDLIETAANALGIEQAKVQTVVRQLCEVGNLPAGQRGISPMGFSRREYIRDQDHV